MSAFFGAVASAISGAVAGSGTEPEVPEGSYLYGEHRYWGIRMFNQQHPTGFFSFMELAFYDEVGGPNLATVPANGYDNGNVSSAENAAKLFDGLLSTKWGVSTSAVSDTLGAIVWYDFGESNKKNILGFKINGEAEFVVHGPTAMEVVYSDDAVNWSSAWGAYNEVWDASEAFTSYTPRLEAPLTTPHRYWSVRVVKTGHSGGFGSKEMELREIQNGPDITAPGGVITSTRHFGTESPDKLIDNNLGTVSSAATPLPINIWYDFGVGAEKVVNEVTFISRAGSDATQLPTLLRVSWSDDGVTYTPHFVAVATRTTVENVKSVYTSQRGFARSLDPARPNPVQLISTTPTVNPAVGNTLNVAMPATVVRGDLLVVHVSIGAAGTVVTTPVGWLLLDQSEGTRAHTVICYRLATGTEGGTTVTFTSGVATTQHMMGVVSQYRGVDQNKPVAAYNMNFQQVATGQNLIKRALPVKHIAMRRGLISRMYVVAGWGSVFTPPTIDTSEGNALAYRHDSRDTFGASNGYEGSGMVGTIEPHVNNDIAPEHTPYRAHRIMFAGSYSSQTIIPELAFFDRDGNKKTPLANTATYVTASQTDFLGTTPMMAFDGDLVSHWRTNTPLNAWVAFDAGPGNEFVMGRLDIISTNTTRPTGITIQGATSLAGPWTDLWTIADGDFLNYAAWQSAYRDGHTIPAKDILTSGNEFYNAMALIIQAPNGG